MAAARAYDPCAGAARPRHVMSRYCNALRNDPARAPRLAMPPAAPASTLPEELKLLPPLNTDSTYSFSEENTTFELRFLTKQIATEILEITIQGIALKMKENNTCI